MRQITINDLPVGRSVDETLRLIQAFQFVEKHGEGKPISTLEIIQNLVLPYDLSLSSPSLPSQLETRVANY